MLHSGVYIAILILVNLNYFIECGGKRQTVCLKELHAFSVPKITGNASSDTRLNICSTIFGCCNKTIEDEMKSHITKKLMHLIHGQNERAKRQFKDVYDDLQGLFQNSLQQTAASLLDSLQSQERRYIAQQVTPTIRTLFEELQMSVTNKKLNVENSTTKFFKNLYPFVYQYVANRNKLPGEFAQCLKDNIRAISPFENVPPTLTAFLLKKLIPVQVILRSLQTIGHVVDAIDNVELSEECSFALVKMSYCSLCDGFSDVKPCLHYCTDVISSCLEPYTVIEEHWSSFVTKMETKFRNVLAKSLDALNLFTRLQELLSESLSHASHSKVATKVSKKCGNVTDYTGNKIVSLSKKQTDDLPSGDLGNGDLYLTTDVQNSYKHLPTASDISERLIFLYNNLSSIKTHMKVFHMNLCLNDGLSASTTNTDKCWVGTGLGRYNRTSDVIKNITALIPANNSTIVDDILLFLKKATTEIRNVESRSSKGDYGSGSWPDHGSASGDGSGGSGEPTNVSSYSGTDCNDDDEDCALPSGDGNVNADQPPGKDGEDGERMVVTIVVATTPKSGASTCYTQTLTLGLLLLYFIFSR